MALDAERGKASFDVKQLTHILDRGERFTRRRHEIEKLVQSDPDLKVKGDVHFMSREQFYEEGLRKHSLLIKAMKKYKITDSWEFYMLRTNYFPNENWPGSLQTAMFIPTLLGQASEEQKEKWLDKALNYEIMGTYAQTELGHGTFLRGLETTATFVRESDEFELHSPTLTSTKWWPGGLGKTTNFSLVMAQLIIDGKSHGLQMFMVQLRDLSTHQPLPGIILGDIGPKFGYNMIDNGFLRLSRVRIPRGNMLARNAKVNPDGTLVQLSSNSKLTYGTMIFVRAGLVYDVSARGLAQAVTIATRYSAVRHQSEMKPGAGEIPVLDYQSQQLKLFPLLASAYAYWFTGQMMAAEYQNVNNEIMSGNVKRLPELHALSSGLKAQSVWQSCRGIDECRMACGGHGYSQSSGIPKIFTFCTPANTFEGETTVLLLQTARFLIKNLKATRTGQAVSGSVSYLQSKLAGKSTVGPALQLNSLQEAFQFRAQSLAFKALSYLTEMEKQMQDDFAAWNASHYYLIETAKAHVDYYIMAMFVDKVQSLTGSVKQVLERLCQLYCLHNICKHSGDFISSGYMSVGTVHLLEEKMLQLLHLLRPDAIALVDAFDFSDHLLGSVLGRKDGEVYKNLYEWAQQEPLNKTQVHPSFFDHMKPLQEHLRSQL